MNQQPFPIYPIADINDDGFEGVEICWRCEGTGEVEDMNCPECSS